MARVKTITKARRSKRQRLCNQCRHEIQAGETYRYVRKKTGPASGFTLFWCADHHPRPSDLMSGRAAELTGLAESLDDGLAGVKDGDITGIVDGLEDVDSVQDFYEELREAAENIEDAFNAAVPQSDVLNEAADAIEEWYERLAEVKGDAEMAVTEGSTDPDIFRELLEQANEAIGEVPDVEFSA